MAYNDSGTLSPGSPYQLGGYSFELKVQNSHEAGEEDTVSVFAICRGPDGGRETQAQDFPAGTTVESWSVEANETEATVYAFIQISIGGGEKTSPFIPYTVPISGYSYDYSHYSNPHYGTTTVTVTADKPISIYKTETNYAHQVIASPSPGTANTFTHLHTVWDDGRVVDRDDTSTADLHFNYTYGDKTVYYDVSSGRSERSNPQGFIANGEVISRLDAGQLAWTMVYGDDIGGEYETSETLIGRFAIDLKEAGGGPGGGWDEPGSVEPDPEPEQTHTLTLTAIAALSGRHNDPLNDTSYSYLPADNDTVKPYGCGGDGGHGGGGGGGASSMVVRQIVTDKASHVEYSTQTKRHGYGSGGGKGGKGGDGCILIFY